jgi:hypothetical protein
MATRWPVRAQFDVAPEHLDETGTLRNDVVTPWIDEVCRAYFERCPRVQTAVACDGVELRCDPVRIPAGALGGHPEAVAISVGASEFRPDSFTLAVRIRPGGGDDDRPVNIARDVSIVDTSTGAPQPLGNDIRDELIALAHAAQYFN